MKLAPSQNTLQPLPPNVQPAVSQNVQRSATPADIQTIQTVQAQQQGASQQQADGPVQVSSLAPDSSSTSVALWVVVIVVLLVASAFVWFWRSF